MYNVPPSSHTSTNKRKNLNDTNGNDTNDESNKKVKMMSVKDENKFDDDKFDTNLFSGKKDANKRTILCRTGLGVTLQERVEMVENDYVNLRNVKEELHLELDVMKKRLERHEIKCTERNNYSQHFFKTGFKAQVKEQMDKLCTYTFDSVAKVTSEFRRVEENLLTRWKTNNAEIQAIQEKESKRSVALDYLISQNKN